MIAQVGATFLHIFWCWLLVINREMGVAGLGLAVNITNISMLSMVEIYSLCIPRIKESIICPNSSTFKNWGEYFKLGIPATVMICAEFWTFEILIWLSGLLGVYQLASAVIFN